MSRLLVVTFLLAAPIMRGQQSGGAPGDPVVTFKVFFNQIEIGSLAGVSYDDGKYLLYATKPEPGKTPVILYRDTVIQLGRLVMALGGDDPGAGMSLDFVPNGRKKYTPEDVLDVPRFAEILGSGRNLAVVMRASPSGAELLKQCMALKKDEKPSKALRGRIADLLNQVRSRGDIEALIAPEDLLPETRVFLKTVHEPLRKARIEMDDFFRGAVDKDVEEKYQVVYKASTPEGQEKIRPLLVNTRASAIWTAADTRLKMMAAGKEGLGYKIGPGQEALCAEEMQHQLARGIDLNAGQFVDYFRLVVSDYEDMGGVGEWFRNPTLEAVAGRVTGRTTPTCAIEWSARLSKRMSWILQQEDDPVAADLRALLQILLLHRALVYLFLTAPMDMERLNLLQRDADDLPSDPPKVMKSEIAFGARGEARVLKIAGGIDWGGNNPAPHPAKAADPPQLNQEPLRDNPGFLVTDMPASLLRIDITSILAP